MAQDAPKIAPRWPQDGPNMAQDGPKMTPRCAQQGSRNHLKSLKTLGKINIFGRGLQLGPKKPQDGQRVPQDGPKMAQDGPKMAQDGPKMAPRGPKMAPRGPKRPQDGPKMAPRGPKMGSGWAQKPSNYLGEMHIFAYPVHLDSKMAPRGPKIPQDSPKRPQDGPRWAQEVPSWGLTPIGGRSTGERVSMFGRPWPLGRLARAVLFLNFKNKIGIQNLNTPWAEGPANFCTLRVTCEHDARNAHESRGIICPKIHFEFACMCANFCRHHVGVLVQQYGIMLK